MTPRALLTGLVFAMVAGPAISRGATLGDEIEASLRVTAVTGREEPAAAMVLDRVAGLPASRDALGNVLLELGSGEPRRLVACALGEPGFMVSAIRDDGYLRLVPIGNDLVGALWTQSHEGQTVVVGGAQGWRTGAVALRSVHLQQDGAAPLREGPATAEDLYVDVGAETAAEVGRWASACSTRWHWSVARPDSRETSWRELLLRRRAPVQQSSMLRGEFERARGRAPRCSLGRFTTGSTGLVCCTSPERRGHSHR